MLIAGYFHDMDLSVFEGQMKVNYYGALYAVHALYRGMVSRNTGHICLVGSALSLFGMIGYSAYCPSKYAVKALADCLRNEVCVRGCGGGGRGGAHCTSVRGRQTAACARARGTREQRAVEWPTHSQMPARGLHSLYDCAAARIYDLPRYICRLMAPPDPQQVCKLCRYCTCAIDWVSHPIGCPSGGGGTGRDACAHAPRPTRMPAPRMCLPACLPACS